MPAALTTRHLFSAVALVVIDERIEIVVLNHLIHINFRHGKM
jgi:hypothetical protein